MSDPLIDSSTPTVSRYANERLGALTERNAHLERNIEAAIAALGSRPDIDEHLSGVIQGLTSALVDSFRSTLLCLAETTDAMLDEWIPQCDEHDTASPASEVQG